MRTTVLTGLCLVVLTALGGCGGDVTGHPEDGGLLAGGDADGVDVQARQDVLVSQEPLGDLVIGTLEKGASATALCFVRHATTGTGLDGSAIRVQAGDLVGYAAVSDFPPDPADRQMLFDAGEDSLRDRLPACPD